MISVRHQLIAVFILSFGLYANTFTHGYALDDAIAITGNAYTQKGIAGIYEIFTTDFFEGFFGQKKDLVAGGRYRPLSIATFALEQHFFGGAAWLSHVINALLYALSCLLFLLVALKLTDKTGTPMGLAAFAAACIFASHPLHTEVVANIKGRDEILALLGALLALYFVLGSQQAHGKKAAALQVFAFISFAAGLFSKENAIAYLAAAPAALVMFRGCSLWESVKKTGPLLAAAVFFLAARWAVVGGFSQGTASELMNDPFIDASSAERYFTVFYTWAIYAKLLVFPHPLTYDYYPYHIPLVGAGSIAAWAGLLLFSAAALWSARICILQLAGRPVSSQQKIYAFSGLLFFVPFILVSNLLFPIGTFMNERFLFMPSVGASLAAGCAISFLIAKGKRHAGYILLFVVVAGFSAKAFARNSAWKDDFTLFTTDVLVSSNSAKSNCSAGGKLLERANDSAYSQLRQEYLELSGKYLARAVQVHPTYADALLLLGNLHFELEQYDSTLYFYLRLAKRAPRHERMLANLAIVLDKKGDSPATLDAAKAFYALNPNNYAVTYKYGALLGKVAGNLPESIKYLERAAALDPSQAGAWKDLGVAYGMSGRAADALSVLDKAAEIAPADYQIYINRGIALASIGRQEEAAQAFAKARELQGAAK
jgi:protein O-mannosyl-transferase